MTEPHDLIIDILRGLQKDMAELRADVAELKSDVAELKIITARLDRRMDANERNVHMLDLKIDDLNYLMKGFWRTETAHETRLAQLERRIGALEARQEQR